MIGLKPISNDTLTLIGLGAAAVVVVWLVFSVLKKLVGLVFLAAVVVAGFMLWQNPAMRDSVVFWLRNLIG